MKLKLLLLFSLVITAFFFLVSCDTYDKVTTLNPKTGRFNAYNVNVKITTASKANTDTLKKLIIVPNSSYWIGMVKNMNYFDEIMTFSDMDMDITKKGLADKIPSLTDKIGLNRAYNLYRPFFVLYFTQELKNNQLYFGLALYDPGKVETIFENKVFVNHSVLDRTDQKTMYPLFNSLLDYLHGLEKIKTKK
ncbi:MAG: hypothetical protein WCR42_12550 [bacterium]